MNGCDFYCNRVTNNNNNNNVNPYINSIFKYNDNTGDTIIAKGGSAATRNYWREEDKHVLLQTTLVQGPSVILPDGSLISSSETGQLPLSPLLSFLAQTAAVMPELKSS